MLSLDGKFRRRTVTRYIWRNVTWDHEENVGKSPISGHKTESVRYTFFFLTELVQRAGKDKSGP
jgi:hypothetical protein